VNLQNPSAYEALLDQCPFIVGATAGAVERWRDAAARKGGAQVHIGSLQSLLEIVEKRLMFAPVMELGETERICILLDIVHAHPELEASLRVDPEQLAAMLLKVLDELALHGLHRVSFDPQTLAVGPGASIVRSHLVLLAGMLRTFRSEIAKRGVDVVSRLERASANRASHPWSTPLVVDGWEALTPLERQFLDGLCAPQAPLVRISPEPRIHAREGSLLGALQRPATKPIDAAPDGSLLHLTCRDRFEEAEAAAAWALSHLSRGEAPTDLVIQAPSGDGYADLLSRVFREHGLSLRAADRSSVVESPLFQAFRAFIRLWWNGPDVFDLASLFSAAGSGIFGGRKDRLSIALLEKMPARWSQVREVVGNTFIAATGKDKKGLAVEPERMGREKESLEAAAAILEELEKGLFQNPRPAEQASIALVDAVRWFMTTFGNPHRLVAAQGVSDRDALSHAATAHALQGGAQAFISRSSVAGPLVDRLGDASSFLHALESFLPDLRDNLGAGSIELRLGDSCGSPVKHLLIVGFARGQWPSPGQSTPLLGELERKALRALGGSLAELPLASERAALAASRARAVLGQAIESLTLVSPSRTSVGKDTSPALVLTDLTARLTPQALLDWRSRHQLSFRSEAASALGMGFGDGVEGRETATRRQALRAISFCMAKAKPLSPRLRALTVSLREARRSGPLAARWRPDQTFQLPATLNTAREYSASGLEKLLVCKYQFHVLYLMGLRPLSLSRRPSLDVRDIGSVVHKVLEHLGADLPTATNAQIAAALKKTLDEDYPWALMPRYALSVQGIEKKVRSFIPYYGRLAQTLRFSAGESEVPFGVESGKPVTLPLGKSPAVHEAIGTARLQLRGSVDRVERVTLSGKEALLAIDFKSGNVSKFEKMRAMGLGLQAALYPFVIETLRKDAAAGFSYLSVDNRRGDFVAAEGLALPEGPHMLRVDGNHTLRTFQTLVVDAITDRLALLVGNTRAGGLGDVSPHSKQTRERFKKAKVKSCEYCEAALLCRFESQPDEGKS
jgi:hypothetical protein